MIQFDLRRAISAFLLVISVLWATPGWTKTPEIEEFTLDNGMRFILLSDPQSTSTMHALWYQVGSADEPQGQSGLAHFLEHLMYKGTNKNNPGTYINEVAGDGAEFNAFTNYEHTVYHVRMPPDLLDKVMELEADRMRGLVIREDLMNTERLVIKEERRQRQENTPSAQLSEQLQMNLFEGHPYGLPVAGLQTSIDRLTRDDALAFYNTHYHPQYATSIVSGNISLVELKALAEKHFGAVPRGPERNRMNSAPLPDKPKLPRIEIESETATNNITFVSFAVPSLGEADKREAIALDFLATIMASGTQGRLVKTLVLDQKAVLDVNASYDGWRRLGGELSFSALPSQGFDSAHIEKVIAAELKNIMENGVTQEEIDSAFRRAEISQIYAWDSQTALVNTVGVATSLGFNAKDSLTLKGWEKITPQDVQAAARKYLTPDRALTGVLRTKKGN
jgi:zinc protease